MAVAARQVDIMDPSIVFVTSGVYRDMLNNCTKDIAESIMTDQIKERGYTLYEIHIFLAIYKTITYTEDNINHYTDIVEYFAYDIAEEFCKHIYFTYIKQQKFLDKVCQYGTMQRVIRKDLQDGTYCNCASAKPVTTVAFIKYVAQHVEIWNFRACQHMTNSALFDMNLRKLDIAGSNVQITNKSIVRMTKLKSLRLSESCMNQWKVAATEIFNSCKEIEELTTPMYYTNDAENLEDISKHVLFASLKSLPKLKKLTVAEPEFKGLEWTRFDSHSAYNIHDNELEELDLEIFTLYHNKPFIGKGLKHMTHLTELNFEGCNIKLKPISKIQTLKIFTCKRCNVEEDDNANMYMQQIKPVSATPYPLDLLELFDSKSESDYEKLLIEYSYCAVNANIKDPNRAILNVQINAKIQNQHRYILTTKLCYNYDGKPCGDFV